MGVFRKHEFESHPSPKVWMATVFCVALLAALCTPTMAAYTHIVTATCTQHTGDTCGISNLVQRTGSGYHASGDPCPAANGSYYKSGSQASSATFTPNLVYGGWF